MLCISLHSTGKEQSTVVGFGSPGAAMADDSGMLDYLELSFRSIHKVNSLVSGGTLEINGNLCRNVISHELQVLFDFLMLNWEKLLVKDIVHDRRRVALLQLYAVIKQAENLVQQCCESNDSTWPERALSLRAMKEDVLDILLHLRWWRSILDMVIESAMSPLPNASSTQLIESNRLECANREFEEMLNLMALFDIMDSSTIDETKRKGDVKRRTDTLQRVRDQMGPAYAGELGTKEHLEFILSWSNVEPESSMRPTISGLIRTQRLDNFIFKNVLMRCIELYKAALEDKKCLVNKALDVMGSVTGEAGSREHHAYLCANQVYSLLTGEEVDGIPELNEYSVKCTIGQSAFGVVNQVTWCGLDCVLKQTVHNPKNSERSEVKSLKRFSHPHIVKFYRHFVDSPGDDEIHSPQSSILMERMPINLKQHMKNLKDSTSSSSSPISSSSSTDAPFSEPVAVDIMLQMAKAMWHMHSRHVLHGDLKPGNVLVRRVSQEELPELSAQGYVQVKLGDFGRVREITVSSHPELLMAHEAGTSVYRAPELSVLDPTIKKSDGGETKAITIKTPHRTDLWSFGMLSSEILSGEIPFSSDLQMGTLLENIQKNVRPRIPEDCPDYLRFCIESCWKYEPLERPRFADIWRMLRIAKLRSLGLMNNNRDWFMYKGRGNHVVGINTGPVLLRAAQKKSERTAQTKSEGTIQMKPERTASDGLARSSKTKPAKGNFSFLLSFFLKIKTFGTPKLTLEQGLDIHYVSPHRQRFGCLVNKVWPPDKVTSNLKLDVIFFEGNVGGRRTLSCRDTWLQRDRPKVFWPRDWLPEDVHNERIRVLVLEYCISETGLEGLVSDIKKSLIFSDRWNLNGTWERPVVLVGHSLGCTVIEALVLDLEESARQRFRDSSEGPSSESGKTAWEASKAFVYSLRGCFFYAYPSYGLVKSHALLKVVFGGLTYSDELFGEEFQEGSQKIVKRSADFLRAARGQNPQIRLMSLIEGGHTREEFVVQRFPDSPECDLSIENNLVLEDSNHIETCKPVDREHPSYRELVEFLIINSFRVNPPYNGEVFNPDSEPLEL
ncbi:hypothetical protein M758_6G067200 [Ceratodon purpureus]|nr:hypothetical protein M758_6G067200 [Ceratodon purpureus]